MSASPLARFAAFARCVQQALFKCGHLDVEGAADRLRLFSIQAWKPEGVAGRVDVGGDFHRDSLAALGGDAVEDLQQSCQEQILGRVICVKSHADLRLQSLGAFQRYFAERRS